MCNSAILSKNIIRGTQHWSISDGYSNTKETILYNLIPTRKNSLVHRTIWIAQTELMETRRKAKMHQVENITKTSRAEIKP